MTPRQNFGAQTDRGEKSCAEIARRGRGQYKPETASAAINSDKKVVGSTTLFSGGREDAFNMGWGGVDGGATSDSFRKDGLLRCGGRAFMPVSHYWGSSEDPLRIPLVYALAPGGSTGDPQGIHYSLTPAFKGGGGLTFLGGMAGRK